MNGDYLLNKTITEVSIFMEYNRKFRSNSQSINIHCICANNFIIHWLEYFLLFNFRFYGREF